LDGSAVTASNFPLPGLGDRLLQLAIDLHDGKGFFVLRGLNPADYSPEDNIVIFLGISSYIAERRGKQDEAGNMLCQSYAAAVHEAVCLPFLLIMKRSTYP